MNQWELVYGFIHQSSWFSFVSIDSMISGNLHIIPYHPISFHIIPYHYHSTSSHILHTSLPYHPISNSSPWDRHDRDGITSEGPNAAGTLRASGACEANGTGDFAGWWAVGPPRPEKYERSSNDHQLHLVGGLNPSEKWWSSSIGMIIEIPKMNMGKCHKWQPVSTNQNGDLRGDFGMAIWRDDFGMAFEVDGDFTRMLMGFSGSECRILMGV